MVDVGARFGIRQMLAVWETIVPIDSFQTDSRGLGKWANVLCVMFNE